MHLIPKMSQAFSKAQCAVIEIIISGFFIPNFFLCLHKNKLHLK